MTTLTLRAWTCKTCHGTGFVAAKFLNPERSCRIHDEDGKLVAISIGEPLGIHICPTCLGRPTIDLAPVEQPRA